MGRGTPPSPHPTPSAPAAPRFLRLWRSSFPHLIFLQINHCLKTTTQLKAYRKMGNLTPPTPKLLNRRSPKFVRLTTSQIPTHMQNFTPIHSGVYSPHMREIAHPLLGYFSFLCPHRLCASWCNICIMSSPSSSRCLWHDKHRASRAGLRPDRACLRPARMAVGRHAVCRANPLLC